MVVITKVSGMHILLKYERRLPYLFSDLILNNVFIKKFVNFLMKDGRKYNALKVFYSILSFVYSYFGIDPLFIIAYIFSRNRVKYEVRVKKIRSNRELYFFRPLYGPSQLFRSMHFFFSEIHNVGFDVSEYYKKVGLMLVYCFIRPEVLRNRLKYIYDLVFKNRYRLPPLIKQNKLSKKSTMYYWALSKSHYSVNYRRNRKVLKRVYV
jgi:hypothetical protein